MMMMTMTMTTMTMTMPTMIMTTIMITTMMKTKIVEIVILDTIKMIDLIPAKNALKTVKNAYTIHVLNVVKDMFYLIPYATLVRLMVEKDVPLVLIYILVLVVLMDIL